MMFRAEISSRGGRTTAAIKADRPLSNNFRSNFGQTLERVASKFLQNGHRCSGAWRGRAVALGARAGTALCDIVALAGSHSALASQCAVRGGEKTTGDPSRLMVISALASF
jgi:hypothetical protein